jgi:16S rRNA (guanine527-N7)-methyltransferase
MRLNEKIDAYESLLKRWQNTINLVGPSTISEARKRHFEDSLQLLEDIPAAAKTLYDLGSGAGFPGLVLAIAKPDLDVHLIESDARKCQFLKTVSRETETPVTVHNQRIESVNLPPPDVLTSRALANLSTLFKLTQKWWEGNPRILLIFPKGENFQQELSEAQKIYKFEHKLIPSQTDPTASIILAQNISIL